jgi:methyl halide transferase
VSPAVLGLIGRYFPPAGRVLIPGCGRGHEALYLAERGYGVTAVDLVAEPLAHLRQNARARGLEIEIVLGDALALAPDYDALFDVFLEQSFFGAIHPGLHSDYEALAYRTLKPGGQLLGLFMEVPWRSGPPYDCPPELVLARFPASRWHKGQPEPVDVNPARPGPEYALRIKKLPLG